MPHAANRTSYAKGLSSKILSKLEETIPSVWRWRDHPKQLEKSQRHSTSGKTVQSSWLVFSSALYLAACSTSPWKLSPQESFVFVQAAPKRKNMRRPRPWLWSTKKSPRRPRTSQLGWLWPKPNWPNRCFLGHETIKAYEKPVKPHWPTPQSYKEYWSKQHPSKQIAKTMMFHSDSLFICLLFWAKIGTRHHVFPLKGDRYMRGCSRLTSPNTQLYPVCLYTHLPIECPSCWVQKHGALVRWAWWAARWASWRRPRGVSIWQKPVWKPFLT